MPTWRDDWDGPPNVVVISETPVTEEGTIEDALLFVLDDTPEQVTLTDSERQPLLFTLPADALAGSFFRAGLDLPTQQENLQ